VMVICLRETYTPALLRKRAVRLRKETGNDAYRSQFCPKSGESQGIASLVFHSVLRPIKMTFLEPICCAWAVFVSVIYGILYLNFASYPIIFTQQRGYSIGITGLCFLGIAIGTLVALFVNPVVFGPIYLKHPIDPATGNRPPEARLGPIKLGVVLVPIGLFWFACTCEPQFSPFISIAAGVPFGLGSALLFINANNYLVDVYSVRFAASALASNAMARSIFGGTFPLFAPIMYDALGLRNAGLVLASLSILFIPVPWVFQTFGPALRAKSKYAD